MFKRQASQWWRAAVLLCTAMTASPVHAGPFVDWFKNMNSPPKPPCTARTCAAPGTCATPGACAAPANCAVPGACGTALPNTYYPGAPAPAAAAPTVVPGPVTYGAVPPGAVRPGTVVQPGTVIQPNYSQPGYPAPVYGAPATIPPPGTVFPNTVTPGPAYPPRATNYAPPVAQAAYYPGTAGTVMPAAAMAPINGAPINGAPVAVSNQPAAYYAPAAACPTCPQPAAPAVPRTVQFAPYTAYRTSWIQVPVTVYRPITAIDPATGRPVTVVQPCTATAWQAQRIPVSGQSFLSRYQPLPVSTPPGAVVAAPPGVVACPGGVCPAPVGAGTMPAAPVYAAPQPGTSLPGTTLSPMPPTANPAMPAPPSQPSYLGAPARVAPGGASATPADRAPTLGPNEGVIPGSTNYPPQRDPYQASPLNVPPPPYIPPPPSSSFPGASAPSSPAPTTNRSAASSVPGATPAEPATRLEPRVNVPSSTSPSGVTRPSTPAARPSLPIKPLPDPDADSRDEVDRSVPRLIVPQERTAASRGAQPVHRVVPTPAPSPIRGTTSSDRTWDDNGWKTSRP